MSSELIEVVKKWIAKNIEAPTRYARTTWAATLSLVETLSFFVSMGIATDIGRIKEAQIKTIEAKATAEEAKANKVMAEAVDATNKATLHKRKDVMARAELEAKSVETAKTQAEGDAIKMDAETRRIEAVAKAKATLIDAISSLRLEGGDLMVDRKNLESLLGLSAPPHDEDQDSDS